MDAPANPRASHALHLADALKQMFAFRKYALPWQFLLNNSPKLDVEQLVAGNDWSMSGHMRTLSRLMMSAAPELADRPPLGDEPGDAVLTTSWHFVPHYCFDAVSVGAVVGENHDAKRLLFTEGVAKRYTRYARDDRTGDFFVLMVDADADVPIAEILYIKPHNNRERMRAFVRFDYAPFIDAIHAASTGPLDIAALAASVITSNIVQECRRCPSCLEFTGLCACPLSLSLPSDGNDRECNARNMAANVGYFLGTAYHYIRQYGLVLELMTQCEFVGGPLTPGVSQASRLYDWALYNRLYECPITVSSPISNSHASSADGIPAIGIVGEESAPYTDEVFVLQATLPAAYRLPGMPGMSHVPARFPGAGPSALPMPSQVPIGAGVLPAVTIPVAARPSLVTTSPPLKPQAPGVCKPSGRGRGRRKQRPIVRPEKPVALRPAGAIQTPAPDAGPEQYYSKEEWESMQKTLRSRESAARSNAKRKQKSLQAKKAKQLEKEKRQQQANQA